MTEKAFPRRLSAILSADAVGYSRLMRDDEEATVRTITAYRNAMIHLIQQYRGRVVDSPGDNILAEFTSVVDSVNCAVEIQRELAERNAELPKNRRMLFRIGINLGDVLEEGKRIYGDGVNVAARMEALAEAGGICISGMVYGAVESKIGLKYEFIGEHEVKNIDKPIRAYQVLTHPGDAAHRVIQAKKSIGKACRKGLWGLLVVVLVGAGLASWHFYFRTPPIEPASIKKMVYPLPDKPSIAVLPFLNMSGDTKQEYLCDGITDEIITNLSKVPRLFVIARNSTFTYKGKHVKIQQVGEDLGVRYVLEGSFMKAGNRVRVNAQLIDAVNGFHMWSETYSREIDDLFALQDQIAFKVVAALQVELTEGDQALIVAGRTKNFDAYAKFLRGLEYIKRFNREGNILARKMAEEIIALDPNYPRGYRLLASTHWLDFRLGMSKNPKQSLTMAVKLYQKVISMDPSEAVAYAFLGTAYTMMRKYSQGVEAVDKAVAVNPNAADAHGLRAFVYYFDGKHKEAIVAIKKAIRLNPFPPNWYYAVAAQIYSIAGFYDEAFRYFKKTFKINPDHFAGRVALAATYSMTNEEKMAHAEIEKILKQEPAYCVQRADKSWPFKKQSDKNLFLNALRKAGLPETPSLPIPDKPSIAVLPFVNMSDDPKQEYFSDGISEDIITDLSKIAGLIVISRNSSFSYKGKGTKIPVIAKELGVKYVLEGSIRKAGNEVRINAQLIDAVSDRHIWADRFDGKYENIFDLQDRITNKIVSALSVNISRPEQKVIADKGTNNLLAYDEYLKGIDHVRKFTPKDYVKAVEYFKKALAIDPNYSRAYAELAYIYYSSTIGGQRFWDAMLTDFFSSRLSTRHYLELAMKNPSSRSYQVLARMELYKRNYDRAIDHAERAVALAPNDADAWDGLGVVMVYTGHPMKGIKYYKRSIMLDPLHKSTGGIGFAYFAMGDYVKAVKYLAKSFEDNPERKSFLCFLAAAHAFLGDDEKAKKAYEDYHAQSDEQPKVQEYYYLYPFEDSKVFDRMIEGMIKAGFKAGSLDYFKLIKENRMTGQEIQESILGKTITGVGTFSPWTRKMASIEASEVNLFSGKYRGNIRIDGDEICQKYKTFQGIINDCAYIYKNPQGTRETLSEYLLLTDYWLLPFSIEE